jgi:putative transposase
MISAPDRRQAVKLIDEACQAGARCEKACRAMGISVCTYQRWTGAGGTKTDGRPTAQRPEPANKLSEAERQRVLQTCHEGDYANLPPNQIVPLLADRGEYIASESTFYRLLRQADEQHHRGRAKAPRKVGPPASHCATGPCEVWSWDITWLPGPVRGLFYYLYLILDIYSRKIVGWEVYEREASEHASAVVRRAVLSEHCLGQPLVLHADNGSPQKGSMLLATLEALGVQPSYSRPRVSDDNPFSEAIFRTCKYRPEYPHQGFDSISDARDWVLRFVHWYNHQHLHSGIGYVTPAQRHLGHDKALLHKRRIVYAQARAKHPERWRGSLRSWQHAGAVWLNPESESASRPENQKAA